jgi:hypothetical protein
MITVKAKKQTELATKRRHRSTGSFVGQAVAKQPNLIPHDVMSIDSDSQSPRELCSPKSSPIPRYSYEYRTMGEPTVPKPYQPGRPSLPLSPQSGQSTGGDVSDIFYTQTKRILPCV